jgi:hypothetical protein
MVATPSDDHVMARSILVSDFISPPSWQLLTDGSITRLEPTKAVTAAAPTSAAEGRRVPKWFDYKASLRVFRLGFSTRTFFAAFLVAGLPSFLAIRIGFQVALSVALLDAGFVATTAAYAVTHKRGHRRIVSAASPAKAAGPTERSGQTPTDADEGRTAAAQK